MRLLAGAREWNSERVKSTVGSLARPPVVPWLSSHLTLGPTVRWVYLTAWFSQLHCVRGRLWSGLHICPIPGLALFQEDDTQGLHGNFTVWNFYKFSQHLYIWLAILKIKRTPKFIPLKLHLLGLPWQFSGELCLPMWEVWVQSQVRELGSHMDSQQKNQKVKQKQYVTNSKKTLKMVHIKKKVLNNKTVHSMVHIGHMQYCHDIYYYLINNFFQWKQSCH